MAKYANALRAACSAELAKSQGSVKLGELQLANAVEGSPKLAKLVAMREELRQLWTRTNVSADQLLGDLQAWCKKAESSGIEALEQFSIKLRAAHA